MDLYEESNRTYRIPYVLKTKVRVSHSLPEDYVRLVKRTMPKRPIIYGWNVGVCYVMGRIAFIIPDTANNRKLLFGAAPLLCYRKLTHCWRRCAAFRWSVLIFAAMVVSARRHLCGMVCDVKRWFCGRACT